MRHSGIVVIVIAAAFASRAEAPADQGMENFVVS
jgi:hypothetical protein